MKPIRFSSTSRITSTTNLQPLESTSKDYLQPHESTSKAENEIYCNKLLTMILHFWDQLASIQLLGWLPKTIFHLMRVLPKPIFNPKWGLPKAYMKLFVTRNQPIFFEPICLPNRHFSTFGLTSKAHFWPLRSTSKANLQPMKVLVKVLIIFLATTYQLSFIKFKIKSSDILPPPESKLEANLQPKMSTYKGVIKTVIKN